MKKTIEFNTSTNDMSAQLTRGKSSTYEDLVLVEGYRKYRHRFEPGKTKIRLLPALMGGGNWMLQIPTLQNQNGRHADPRTVQVGVRSVFDLAFSHMKEKCPTRLFSRANKTGIRLLPSPMSLCWAIVEDSNGIKLRLVLHSFYDGSRGGANGLGNTIYNLVLQAGEKCNLPGHPLNPADGVSLIVERIGGSETKYPSYRVTLADDRGPLQPILDRISEVEHNMLCPVEEIIHILKPEDEWRLLAKVVGDDLAAEIRAAQESGNTDEECGTSSNVEEGAIADDDYTDFPKKWEI